MTTFTIEIVCGYRPGPVELAGAVITVGALVANNLVARREPAAARSRVPEDGDLLEAV